MQNVVHAFVFISIGGMLFGFAIGVTSNIISPGQLLCPPLYYSALAVEFEHSSLLQIGSLRTVSWPVLEVPQNAGYTVGSWTSIGYQQCYKLGRKTGLMTSLWLIGAVISTLFCFRYADGMGRRLEVQVAAVLYFLGALITALSPCLLGIVFGLLIYGFGIGIGMHVAPVYVGEISPAEKRGEIIAAQELIIVAGMLLGFCVGFIFEDTPIIGWRYMISVAASISLIMGICISFFPDSPRWLALHSANAARGSAGDEDAAANALSFYRQQSSAEEIKAELLGIKFDASHSPRDSTWLGCFSYPKPLFIGCGLMVLQQVTGESALLVYAKTIFQSAGFHNSASVDAIVLCVVKLSATLGSAYCVDRFGRRPLLFLGISVMAASLVLIAIAMNFRTCSAHEVVDACPSERVKLPHQWSSIMIIALMLYVSGYQIGFGPISRIIISEVFPLHVRGAALSVAAVANFASNVFLTLSQPAWLTRLGASGVFSAYALMCLVSLGFVWQYVPETRNKTLEEINRMIDASG